MAYYPCRCNRRVCQARRTLKKHPSEYTKWPVCQSCGKGRLAVDKTRQARAASDNAPICTDPNCMVLTNDGKERLPRHRVSNRKCSGWAAYTAERNSKPRSKHCPIPEDERVPF